MNWKKMVALVTVLALLIGVLSSSGCGNTWKGAGKDTEKVGKKMQGKP